MVDRHQDRKIIVSDPEKCSGCRLCEYVCSMVNEKIFNPHKSRIRVISLGPLANMAVSCRKCEDPLCVASCPKNALSQEENTGIIRVNEHACTGCGWCIGACSFGAINLHPDKKIAYTCNSCTNTDNCDNEPQCVQWCTENALQYVTAETLAQKTRQKIVNQLLDIPKTNNNNNSNNDKEEKETEKEKTK
ncbi:MAG: 4Fe-4S dicluster domain-containing protein [Candidatus Bathyarchaeota archaeon]|uniref:4Fe-4S dicluster domain-containing protein n=1 Tax=Candidatus Bathycorpusculum sp. TaxID=2994959 RepID=UPI00281FB69A|nr:4Fe-4S dicluster domain-containing protein [Candidatus Termiticorpusculum sp.]MCL2257547.1 4Fe-4S dicluster domain-containing protein [Candidatus Termiticorpusculum sp.]MCL2292319.1 4Fe-4S dicluster domain-containing protein [Candidatus Termiticorpusculum sp.]